MSPIRYSLHYEDYSEHLMSRFGKLLQMQSLVDMTLMCSSHTLRVHKAVLAASSAYFQEVLQKQTGEPLIILKMRFSVLKCLVEFMYCGKTQCLEENLDELVSAAQFLKIKGLSKVTKEGLGITNSSELPVFTPPVVINRPPQSLIDLHTQENDPNVPQLPQLVPNSCNIQPRENNSRTNKDMVVRIPFDIENGAATMSGDYSETPRTVKPRRGRPSRSSVYESSGSLSRVAERALLRREQDSRKAIHHLKHLQTRHMQNYMDRESLSQAVNSICGPHSSTNYMNLENDMMYMDQSVSSNILNSSISYPNEHSMGNETITSNNYNTNTIDSSNINNGIGTAMSQYVNALKSAGLPTDLPILFESGDGSYINVNEQVLLDMVQSNEIQYEVVEQPNIMEKVADPSEIKSIDDLSKSIERGELLLNKGYSSVDGDYTKESTDYNRQDAINSLNAILPDNLESFAEQQNFVVLDPRIQDSSNEIDQANSDFSCIDGDMQFFTKSMSDDVKKYYDDQQLNDTRVMEQLCPASTSLDTNFSMSLLDSKISHLGSNLSQHYSLNSEELRRSEDCYDFVSNDFKDPLDCLMATPKENSNNEDTFDNSNQLEVSKERDEIIEDLINIENKMCMNKPSCSNDQIKNDHINQSFNSEPLNVDSVLEEDCTSNDVHHAQDNETNMTDKITLSNLEWNDNIRKEENQTDDSSWDQNVASSEANSQYISPVIDMTETKPNMENNLEYSMHDNQIQGNGQPNDSKINSTLDEDIPYAMGLLPLKQIPRTEESNVLKRNSVDVDIVDVDTKCLKRKAKCKKL